MIAQEIPTNRPPGVAWSPLGIARLWVWCAWTAFLALVGSMDLPRIYAAEADEPPKRYRRIFVPADNVEAWPREGEKYLPIDADVFEAWVLAANADAHDPPPAVIREARYSARLQGDRLVDCRGDWVIDQRSKGPAFLSLDDTSLVVRDARWQKAGDRPARIGTWGRNGGRADAGGLEVLLPGTLEFTWNAPTRANHDGIEIEWRVPDATASRIVLDLPLGAEPLIEGGVVLSRRPSSADAPSARGKRQLWELAIDPSSAKTLRIVDPGGHRDDSPTESALREEVVYRITQRGLDVEAIWHLDAPADARQELKLPLPTGLHLEYIGTERRQLPWRIEKTENGEVAVIQPPGARGRRPLRLTVRAWQPLLLERSWLLPRLRPGAVFWQSGTAEISIDRALELQELNLKDCVQTGVSRAEGSSQEPERTRLVMYAPDSEVKVRIGRESLRAAVRLGSSLALGERDITGRVVTDWEVSEGAVHKLRGDLAPGWVVEAVEVSPAEALGEWFIDERGDRRGIEIQLTRAVRPTQSLSVSISGRLPQVGLGEPIPAETMRMVDWSEARVERHLVAFQTVEPYAVETVGDLSVVASSSLSDADRARLDLPSGKPALFDLTRKEKGTGLRLALQRGQYEAGIRIDAVCEKSNILHNYRLRIDPAAAGIDRVLIFATAPLGSDVRWTYEPDNAPLAAERLPASDPRRAGLRAGGELWLVRLPGLTTQTIELVAQADTPLSAGTRLPLLALPEAVDQHGRVLVHAADTPEMPRLEAEGMQAAPLPVQDNSSPSDVLPPVRAVYRYDPVSCLASDGGSRLSFGPGPATGTSAFVVRDLELESYFWSDGRATHRATYELEIDGAASFQLSLPAEAALRALMLDGRALEHPPSATAAQIASIPLPAGARSARISVHFDTRHDRLTAGATLLPPIVHAGIPVLAGNWTVWLPDGFSANNAALPVPNGEFHWSERLFGPLGRPIRESPFQPLSARDWARLLSPLASAPSPDATTKPDLVGWTAYRLGFLAHGPSAVSVAHPTAMTAWAIAMFLSCLVGGRLLRRHFAVFISLLAIAAASTLFLPPQFVPLATGAVLGLAISQFVSWSWRNSGGYDPLGSWSRTTVSLSSVLIILCVAKLAVGEPVGDAASSPAVSEPSQIERVLVPVDGDGRPAGSKVFVTEKLLRELLPTSSERQSERQWLLMAAEYSGTLQQRGEPPGIVAEEWTLTFDVEVLARDTTIVLPIVREEAVWRDTAMLDGVPVPLDWLDEGRRCALEISEPGRYSITLSCRPRTGVEGGRSSVRLSVPRLAGARLCLEYPRSLANLVVDGAKPVGPGAQPVGTLEQSLNDSGKISVHWTDVSWTAGGTQGLRVTGMRWLRIDAEEVGLRVKYVIEGSARRPDFVFVEFDRQWELLDEQRAVPESDPQTRSNGRQSVRVPLSPDNAERQEVTLAWRLTNAKPIGQLRLPPIELVSLPVTHRWLAISTDPAVECTVLDVAASSGAVNEFLAMWGDADDTPQFVLASPQPSVSWSFAVRPKQRESVIDEALHVAAERAGDDARLRIAYQVDVTPGAAHEYQFQLAVPDDLLLDEVVLTAAGRPVPVRSARVDDNHINVFFSQRMDREYRLVLQGTIPVDESIALPMPRVTASSASSFSQNVQLYRDESLLIDVSGLSASDELPDAPRDLPPSEWTTRPVGVYRFDDNAFERVRLTIQPNDLRITGSTLVAMDRVLDEWSASFAARLTVREGRLGMLRLRVPSTWTGPFSIDSSIPATVELTTGQAGPTLAIRFTESIGKEEELEFTVRGALTGSTPATIAVPEIAPKEAMEVTRYLMAPSELDGQLLVWMVQGAGPAVLPADLRQTVGVYDVARTWRVTADQYRVAVQPSPAMQPSARVRLADTAVWMTASGAQLVETQYAINAPDLADCTFRLPMKHGLISIYLDGRSAMPARIDAERWQIPLGPTDLPRMLRIVTVAPPHDGQRTTIQRPVLFDDGKPIPLELSLWSIGVPQSAGRLRVLAVGAVTEADQSALRLERLVSMVESATPTAVEAPPPDGYDWYRPWADRLAALRAEAVDKAARSEGPAVQVSARTNEQLTQASQRLDQWIDQCIELLGPPAQEDSRPTDDVARLAPRLDAPWVSQWVHAVAEGGDAELAIELTPVAATPRQVRMFGTLAILGLAATSIWLVRRPATADFLYRWPHLITFFGGLAYWAWLRPSWLGLAIAGASLLLAWRSGWPGRSLPMERSTVVRVPRSDMVV